MKNVLIFAMCNCTILLVFYKWKVIERYEHSRKIWMPNWCELCFFFWCSLIQFIILNLTFTLNFYLVFFVGSRALATTFASIVFLSIYRILNENNK